MSSTRTPAPGEAARARETGAARSPRVRGRGIRSTGALFRRVVEARVVRGFEASVVVVAYIAVVGMAIPFRPGGRSPKFSGTLRR